MTAWRKWLSCFVWLTESEWNQRAREQALEAMQSGRTPRLPCAVHPARLGQETVRSWYEWACRPPEERFEYEIWMSLPGSWVREVMSDLGMQGDWRHPHIDAGLGAFFLMMRLDMLHLAQDGLKVSLREEVDPIRRRKLVWRECVRIRQHLADMLPLARDLPRGSRGLFKSWWLSSLEWTRLAEQSGEAMWEAPVVLSPASRMQIFWQRWFGRLAFR